MNFDLRQSAKEKLLLVAHRGAWGGNIPCNTIAAYEAALRQGADMIEIDLNYTADGKLIVFHPGMERPLLGFSERLTRCNWDLVKQLRYVNVDDKPTQFGINTLDEVLALHFGVKNDQLAVGGVVEIDLDHIRPLAQRRLVGGNGVARDIARKGAAMPNEQQSLAGGCAKIKAHMLPSPSKLPLLYHTRQDFASEC